jgi:superfamily II DNA/RNA helicase
LVPLIQRLLAVSLDEDDDKNNNRVGLQILVIAPGRELASQIASVARELLQDTNLGVMLAIGGTTFTRNLEQIRKRKPTIIVGTPGRIAELVVGRPGEKSGRLKTSGLKALVLDEFDALLEYKPHREPTSAIMDTLKRRHGNYMQTVMCSATASDILGSPKLREYLRPGFQQAMADSNDLLVTSGDVSSDKASTRVSMTVIHGVLHVPHPRLALDTLRRVLHTEPIPQQILIFAENSRKVRIVVEKLEMMGIIAAPLHGGFGSEKMDRAEVSKALREGYVGIVVATELAARGLDAPLLTHVINFDLPTDASHYAHRAGRCGRGGRPGVVINFTTGPQERNVPYKFADKLGVEMYAVEAKNSQLTIVDPDSQLLDQ